MAASALDGEKICEVSGKVTWSSVERLNLGFQNGSIALYKLSSSYYLHAITTAKRKKFQLRPDKFDVHTRDSRLTLSVTQEGGKSAVSINLKDAAPNQLRLFLDSLNGVRAYNTSFKGKLSSFSSRENSIQDNIENQPCNNINTKVSSTRVQNHESPLRSKLVSSPSSCRTQKVTPNRPTNYLAKQMAPPSQTKKTPLVDQTRARDNLSNTSSLSSGKSASSFYGSNNSTWTPNEWRGTGKSLGPGLMPPPRPWSQTSRLASQISFRSREKRPFEKEVALTGFSNLGNTCYMNAILQSLLGIPPFVQDLSNRALLEKIHPQCLYKCLYNVMLCKRKCENSDVLRNYLRKLKRTISEAATRFSGYHQHDAHEFLCQVLDQLKEDVSTCNSPSSKSTSTESNNKITDSQCPVTRSFESGVVHTISCKQCGESAPKEEIYHVFSLDIPTLCSSSVNSPFVTVSMKTLIEKHFEGKVMPQLCICPQRGKKDEELEYTCSKCESKEAVISHSFSRLPRVLILHLKRYGYDNLTEEQEKKQDKINIERFLDLKMLCSSKTKAPFAFQPKSSLGLSPLKSRRKSQKRHFISDDDDDDSNDFQPSPSVRRKLDHSFADTVTSSTVKDSLPNRKADSEEDCEITGGCKVDQSHEYSHDAVSNNGKDRTVDNTDNHENNVGTHFLGSHKPVWEGTEEEQMEWALAESTKASAEKKARDNSRVQQLEESEVEWVEESKLTAAPSGKDSPENQKINSENGVEITSSSRSRGDCSENNTVGYGKPVWEGTEEEQMKWALAESAKLSAEKESRAKPRAEQVESQTEQIKSESPTSTPGVDFDYSDFALISDLSDEDLVNAADSGADEPRGLKGGAPIATQNCSDSVDGSDVNSASLVNDENSSPKNFSQESGLKKNAEKDFVLKNSPIICVKRKSGRFQRKLKTLDTSVLNKTPTIGKFDGNLFDDIPKENKDSSNIVRPIASADKRWYHNSSAKFQDEDMEKAINMSLQDQQTLKEEDEELKRALELSLQEFERKCPAEDQPGSPQGVDVTDTENLTDSALQDEEDKVSTHSYRLVSIVSHLGARSTSGHYISDVYDCKTKQWTSYDDSTASQVTEHTVRYKRLQSGYIFFYLYKQCVDAIENSSPSKENSQR